MERNDLEFEQALAEAEKMLNWAARDDAADKEAELERILAEFGSKKSGEVRPYGGGNATGVKIDPIGFLVIKEGVVRMINVTPPASNTVDRIIDLVPQVMDRIDAFVEKQKKPGTQK